MIKSWRELFHFMRTITLITFSTAAQKIMFSVVWFYEHGVTMRLKRSLWCGCKLFETALMMFFSVPNAHTSLQPEDKINLDFYEPLKRWRRLTNIKKCIKILCSVVYVVFQIILVCMNKANQRTFAYSPCSSWIKLNFKLFIQIIYYS